LLQRINVKLKLKFEIE